MQDEYKQTQRRTTNELESDDSALPPTKAVSLYGWDSVGLTKVLIACDASGAIKTSGGGGETDATKYARTLVMMNNSGGI